MARATYVPEEFGIEIAAPSGYYRPLAEEYLEYAGRRVLYVSGSACIEASCCGVGSWNYVRVEGYVMDDGPVSDGIEGKPVEIDTIEAGVDRVAIAKLLLEGHPGARVEFR